MHKPKMNCLCSLALNLRKSKFDNLPDKLNRKFFVERKLDRSFPGFISQKLLFEEMVGCWHGIQSNMILKTSKVSQHLFLLESRHVVTYRFNGIGGSFVYYCPHLNQF